MSYFLVSEGFINLCVFIGAIIGVLSACGFIYVLRYIYLMKLKEYFTERNDADKNELMLNLENLDKTYYYLAMKTNLKFFRIESNDMLDLIAYLRKKKLD